MTVFHNDKDFHRPSHVWVCFEIVGFFKDHIERPELGGYDCFTLLPEGHVGCSVLWLQCGRLVSSHFSTTHIRGPGG